MDKISIEARSRNMSQVRNKNTAEEQIVRSALHRKGYRFRLNVKSLPGSPDVVLPKHKLCIFVHGCFWHRHSLCKRATFPKSNQEFWADKFNRNINRDEQVQAELIASGWRVIVIWSCQIRNHATLQAVIEKLESNYPR